MTRYEHVKHVKKILKKWKSGNHTALDDHYNCAVSLEKICNAYLRLRLLAKKYVQEDDLESSRKLCSELEISQWW